jgi:zinc transport system substrate-binding protein
MLIRARAIMAALGTVAALAACGGDGPHLSAAGGAERDLTVLASFYPLQFAAQRVAGDRADVQALTPPGAEPHDVELTPKDVASVSDADLVVYLGGFQPSVDEAVTGQAEDRAFDVAPAARLDLAATGEGEDHEGEEAEGGGLDPHFWLDPTRLAAVGTALGERLAETDPAGAATYRDNARALVTDLNALDAEFSRRLASCANKKLVTSHTAFGYLAQRYGLTQLGITGISPEAEPKAADLASVTSFVRSNRVRTIYHETLVSPAVAKTVAAETGARTAVLDPIEGLTDESRGRDYLAVMRANLASLAEGQPCP